MGAMDDDDDGDDGEGRDGPPTHYDILYCAPDASEHDLRQATALYGSNAGLAQRRIC